MLVGRNGYYNGSRMNLRTLEDMERELIWETPANISQIVRDIGIDLCKALLVIKQNHLTCKTISPKSILCSQDNAFYIETNGDQSENGEFYQINTQLNNERACLESIGLVLYQLTNYGRLPCEPAFPDSLSLEQRKAALVMRKKSSFHLQPPACCDSEIEEIICDLIGNRVSDAESVIEKLVFWTPYGNSNINRITQWELEKKKKIHLAVLVVLYIILMVGVAATPLRRGLQFIGLALAVFIIIYKIVESKQNSGLTVELNIVGRFAETVIGSATLLSYVLGAGKNENGRNKILPVNILWDVGFAVLLFGLYIKLYDFTVPLSSIEAADILGVVKFFRAMEVCISILIGFVVIGLSIRKS